MQISVNAGMMLVIEAKRPPLWVHDIFIANDERSDNL